MYILVNIPSLCILITVIHKTCIGFIACVEYHVYYVDRLGLPMPL